MRPFGAVSIGFHFILVAPAKASNELVALSSRTTGRPGHQIRRAIQVLLFPHPSPEHLFRPSALFLSVASSCRLRFVELSPKHFEVRFKVFLLLLDGVDFALLLSDLPVEALNDRSLVHHKVRINAGHYVVVFAG